MGLCAMGIGMAKTGLGGLGMIVVPVMANIFGGTLPYSYLWSTGGNGYAANNLPAGTY